MIELQATDLARWLMTLTVILETVSALVRYPENVLNSQMYQWQFHEELQTFFFLQKSSDASGKPTYNGNEKVFSSGTEGKPDDYFMYDNKGKQLKLVSKKNYTEVTAAAFANDTAALDKAKSINGDFLMTYR